MAQRYDVSLKALFLREGDGLIRRRLFGGRVVEHLSGEQPKVSNLRADMVVRTEDGALHQVEFQARNEADFGLRMLEYYAYLVRAQGQHVVQVVLYLGREPLRMESGYRTPSMDFRFEIVNLRDVPAEALLESEDWADNALAMLARGDAEKALDAVMPRLRAMQGEERTWAAATLLLLSGILGLEATVDARLKEVGMIDLMENKVLGPLIQKKYEQGLEQGLKQGREEERLQVLSDLLAEKFGSLPDWANEKLQHASSQQLKAWIGQALRSSSIEEALG